MHNELINSAIKLGERLQAKNFLLATAESCTGGWVAQAVTSVPGSSTWFDRGFVTYSNAAKQEMLGVQAATLAAHGAVSEQVVQEMARGALQHSQAQVSIAITGIAGPEGGSADKPVGTVWFAWAVKDKVIAELQVFAGDRQAVRLTAVQHALQVIVLHLV